LYVTMTQRRSTQQHRYPLLPIAIALLCLLHIISHRKLGKKALKAT